MLVFLEEKIEQLQRVKDTARYRHVSISSPLKITKSSFHAVCYHSKQSCNSEG